MAQRADLVGGLPGRLGSVTLGVHERLERVEEGAQERYPCALATCHLVEVALHAGRERHVHVVAEVGDQVVRDDLADLLGVQPARLDADVPAVEDRRDRGGIGGRTADPVLLERLDQRRLGEPRRRLREVLAGGHVQDPGRVALAQRGKRPVRLLGGVVLALGVDPGEAVEQGPRRRGPQPVVAVCQLDRRGLELLGGHLRRERALPDEAVELELVGLEVGPHRLRVAVERRRPNGLVRLLGALGLRLVDPALAGPVRVAEAILDHRLGLGHRHARDRRGVRAHVGDQADMPVGRVHALVQPLRDRHRALGAEAELAARLLLQGAGRERRRRVALRGTGPDRVHDRVEAAQGGRVAARRVAVTDGQRLAADARRRRP